MVQPGKIINLSTMRELVVPACEVGRMVKYTGDMANSPGIGAVIAIRPAGPYNAYQSYDVALEDGREFCATHLDGSRWVILDEYAVGATLEILRAGIGARKATQQAQQSAAKQAFAEAVAKCRSDYPHLEQGGGHVIAAKNIRTELKRAFPGVKFSVRGKSYSGGDSVDVSWTDGPTSQQVDAIISKYEHGSFDGMTDSYNYKRSAWNEVFGSTKYAHASRDYSEKMVSFVIRMVCDRLGGIAERPTFEDYSKGQLWKFKQSGGCDVEREIRSALQKHTYCV